MACAALRCVLTRSLQSAAESTKISGHHLAPIQAASLTFRHGEPKKRPWAFPYEKIRYSVIPEGLDGTKKRLDDESKIVIVEGNYGIGKTTWAKKLARELDFKYIPEPTMEHAFKHDQYDIDLRDFDAVLPPSMKIYDLDMFLKDPDAASHGKAIQVQLYFYKQRFLQYCQGMYHLLNTGQGIVYDRSVFSDIVFGDTLKKFDYVTREGYKFYRRMLDNSICELWRPHLCVYLHAPVSVIREKIKERNIEGEVNSPVLTDEYLQCIEDNYKTKVLHDLKPCTEILTYDWTEMDDWEMIQEDMENLDLDPFSDDIYHHDEKFHDWRVEFDRHYGKYRRLMGRELWKDLMMRQAGFPHDAPEAVPNVHDVKANKQYFKEFVPKSRFSKGWNPDMGDKWIYLSFMRHFMRNKSSTS